MITRDLTRADWRTSSHSDGHGGNCVEVADGIAGAVPVRDTKHNTHGPVLLIRTSAWSPFIDALKQQHLPTA
ncbi:DUF397 domain-containing protein [Streptomyces sp. 4N509B]|uniref:DUF397 domain-containing protein n=1 Tax=Streptomyces sp. 4N509B TaxID=3457413 RepID=UPI003FD4CFBF